MGKQNFSIWLAREVETARYALLALLEKHDHLLYVEAPALRREYMSMIGIYEEEVLECELTAYELERKLELIQTAINQRMPIDMDALEQQLRDECSEKLSALETADKTANELPMLNEEDQKELQSKYRSIIHDFHPQVNHGITATQKELYEKALDAYKRQNIDAIRIIHDMLYNTSEVADLSLSSPAGVRTEEDTEAGIQEYSDALAADYTLAGALYACFSETESDAVIINTCNRYVQQRRALDDEMVAIQSGFPFNARETLRSQALIDEYLMGLRARLHRSEEAIKERTTRIEKMVGVARHG